MNIFHTIIASLILGLATTVAAEQVDVDRTLSPYFQIEQGERTEESFPLKKTDVQVVITGVIADVTVRQTYANMGADPINGYYIFPGSTRAAVHGLTMTIGERVIRAQIQEKTKARTTFTAAKKAGKKASLLEQQRPNVFSMEVANIMPGDTIVIELRYTELLVPEDGTYAFIYPTVVGPRYTTKKGDDPAHAWIANPYLPQGTAPKTAFDLQVKLVVGMPIQELRCPSHQTQVAYLDQSQAEISLDPSAEFGGDRDFILRYHLSDKEIASGLILQHGKEENYFLLMTQPPKQVTPDQIPGREYIFIVDVSGSMHGFPLDTTKVLLQDLIGSLKPSDTFNVLLFSGGSKVMAPVSLPATPANINQALAVINNSEGGGGTELLKAINRAMAFPKQEGVSRSLVVVTDGYIGGEREVFAAVGENLDQGNLFAFGIGSSVNRYLIEGLARAGQGEPFVVTTPDEIGPVSKRFRSYIASPVLTDIKITYEGLEVYDIEPPTLPDLFARRPIIVFGKWRGQPDGTISLQGWSGGGSYQQTLEVAEASVADSGLDSLWARSRIARISDYAGRHTASEARQEIIELGLHHNLLTAHTSFVAVDDRVTNPGQDAKDVKQPLNLPKGVSNLAVSGGIRRVPEPGLTSLALLAALVALTTVIRKRLAARC